MPEINDEMRVTADYAISTAKERYGMELDYSEDSLAVLDVILEKIYWGFSSHNKDEGEGGLIYNAATIWGSYLGEYMRLKWGGTWVLKGTERRISITSIEFAPINFVFQRITSHPEYRVATFIQETKKVIYTSVIHPKQSQYVPESAGQPASASARKLAKKPLVIDKRIVYATGGILGILFIVFACIAGTTLIKAGGLPAFGLLAKATGTYTQTALPTKIVVATLDVTDTATPTMTQLPTYTPKPTGTTRPTRTPFASNTPVPSWTPTITPTPTETEIPYSSPTRTRTPTETERSATRTPKPTSQPSPTNTQQPSDTPIPPPEIISCGVSPSEVPISVPTVLTFTVQFSAPGFEITGMSFNPPLGEPCSNFPIGGGTSVSCNGSTLLGPGTTVDVTIDTSLGSCSTSFHSP